MIFTGFSIQNCGVLLTTLSLAICSCWATCPPQGDSVSLDLEKFAGEWFFVAGTPTSGNTLSKCGHIKVTKKSVDTFNMTYSAISHRHNHPAVTFNMNGTNDANINGTWQLKGSARILGPFNHRILAVEYDSYLVVVVCDESNKDIARKQIAMILSRKVVLTPAVKDHLINTYVKKYFEDVPILDVVHTDCGKIYQTTPESMVFQFVKRIIQYFIETPVK